MLGRKVALHPEAITEAKAAREWYQERSPAAANAFLKELDSAIEQIGESPNRWPSHHHGTRRFLLRRFPFSVVYRESNEVIEVVAIAHGRRRPNYWRNRA